MIALKQKLYNQCIAYVEQRITTFQNAIKTARESANDDTKSSAGDKYETGRAMMQQDIDNNSRQLLEANQLKQVLELIQPDKVTDSVQLGSLVITNKGNFYISISAGQLTTDEDIYFAISSVSPIGAKLMRQKAGGEFNFNGKDFSVLQVY